MNEATSGGADGLTSNNSTKRLSAGPELMRTEAIDLTFTTKAFEVPETVDAWK